MSFLGKVARTSRGNGIKRERPKQTWIKVIEGVEERNDKKQKKEEDEESLS